MGERTHDVRPEVLHAILRAAARLAVLRKGLSYSICTWYHMAFMRLTLELFFAPDHGLYLVLELQQLLDLCLDLLTIRQRGR